MGSQSNAVSRSQNDTAAPPTINVLTLNCWGLKFLSKYRTERLSEIGNRIASYSPQLDIVGLQECWTFGDYLAIRERTQHSLPYAKFYHSGTFGGGLAYFSRWPIIDSSMFRYPLNGRPTAFFRGDWYVGKGVACATIQLPDGKHVEVFNTHLHAPYEREPNDSYICHRTAQAWEIAKLMRAASQRGSLVLGLGDFNMVPLSFAHVLIESRGGVKDVWRVAKPGSSVGKSNHPPEIERRKRMNEVAVSDVESCLRDHGHTCDSVLNTWRWSQEDQKRLEKGTDRHIEGTDADPNSYRLDYIFFSGIGQGWKVADVKVVFTERHPELLCSLSDHFAVHATIERSRAHPPTPVGVEVHAALHYASTNDPKEELADFDDKDFDTVLSKQPTYQYVGKDFYNDILAMIHKYNLRERKQRRWRCLHFLGSALVSIGCFVAVWWSPNYVSFILILLSSLGLMAGTVDGLIGLLFVGSELRALAEFEWEVRNALQLAGGPVQTDRALKDWYD
ncbi:phospholipase C type enzyme [Elasticomyces elasticus]|uniref:Phospholipase C type enzyme n=1 Tax=Exophiala sideris TaxID=1016849 RepID=A0ABR0IWI7_9EURO|nr:phospholipase C type enzyme [Elasticomyces elasticus]KAK5021630.1 phospholipase C type enzyme [Exophiala sideris]KAK5024866.1 phospholipase C type enzyme [Exophiala sideris]KAK5049768.1 phospholipase C type enzyme [Exophiala sideris]KAK5176748.1 phospholipase C type enzyme [Eurotiomycetes sp. CCFEE 6388]